MKKIKKNKTIDTRFVSELELKAREQYADATTSILDMMTEANEQEEKKRRAIPIQVYTNNIE